MRKRYGRDKTHRRTRGIGKDRTRRQYPTVEVDYGAIVGEPLNLWGVMGEMLLFGRGGHGAVGKPRRVWQGPKITIWLRDIKTNRMIRMGHVRN